MPSVCVPKKAYVKSAASTTILFDPKMCALLAIENHIARKTFLIENRVLFAIRLFIIRHDQCENLESPMALKINASVADTNPG